MSGNVASEVVAIYAARTGVELERTLPLGGDEELIIAFSAVTHYSRWSVFVRTRRGSLRLSTKRLCVLRHYGFIRDRVIVIPPGAISNVEGRWPREDVRISFRGERGDSVLKLRTGRRPETNYGVLDSDNVPMVFRQIADALGSDSG